MTLWAIAVKQIGIRFQRYARATTTRPAALVSGARTRTQVAHLSNVEYVVLPTSSMPRTQLVGMLGGERIVAAGFAPPGTDIIRGDQVTHQGKTYTVADVDSNPDMVICALEAL